MLKSNLSFDFTKLEKLGKLSFFCICGILLLLVAAGGYLVWFFYIRAVPLPPEVRNIVPFLRHGDIIMRSGVGLWSELFREYNRHDKRFSHVGIVIVRDGRFFVLHSEGDDISGKGDVHLDTVDDFIGASSGIGISRLHTLDNEMLAENALKYQGRKFDWKFNRKESTMLYCTELIDLALRATAGGEAGLSVGEKDIIPVDSCLDVRYFIEISLK